MDIKQEMEKLLKKLNEVRTSTLGADVIQIIPKINDVNEYIDSIGKLADDLKLDSAWQCLAEGKDVEKSINELYNYVSDRERAFFISNEFKKINLSNSVLASSVIALIVGKVVKENRKCTHKETIILNALGHMTDYDLKNFKLMMDKAIEELVGYTVINIFKLDKENRDNYKYTLHLCANAGLFLTESDIIGKESEEDDFEAVYAGLHYVVIDISYALLGYMNEVKQLLNY